MKPQFFFSTRIINCCYWEVKEYYFLGFCIYSKRINIQPGHESPKWQKSLKDAWKGIN
jgi:hypothetical protein